MNQLYYDAGYGILPRNVMRDERLSIEAKGIFAYLVAFAGNKDHAFPSRELMCKELGVGKDRLGKHMNQLKELGYLEVTQTKEEGKFSRNIYKLIANPQNPSTDFKDTGNRSLIITDNNNNNNNIYTQRYEMRKGFTDEEKDKLWSLYPKKVGKKNAYKYMDRLRKQGYGFEMVVWAIEEYADKVKKANTEMKYIKQGDTFFNTGIYDYIDNYKPRVKEVEDSGETGEFANFLDMVKRGGLE